MHVENTPLPVENLLATSGEKPIEKISLTYKFVPLAHEVCKAIDKMILASQMGPFSDKVNDVLEKIIELCEKATAEFEQKSILKSKMPRSTVRSPGITLTNLPRRYFYSSTAKSFTSLGNSAGFDSNRRSAVREGCYLDHSRSITT
jgi:hypothetical protein